MTAVNVLLISNRYYPRLAGAAIRFHRYAEGLRRRDVHLHVATKEIHGLPVHTIYDNVPIDRILPAGNDSTLDAVRFHQKVHRYLNMVDARPDIIMTLNTSLRTSLLWYSLRRAGYETVYVHTLFSGLSANPLWKTVQKWNRRVVREQFSAIVTSSEVMLNNLRSMGITRPRLEVIANGVDLQRFRPASGVVEKKQLRAKLKLPIDCVLILFVGYLVPRKGIDTLARAWSELHHANPQTHLILVGPRHNEQQPQMSQFYGEIDREFQSVAGSVTFAGKRLNVEEYLRAADIFVFPSRKEGMPNVVSEAMATRIPVVMTPFLGLPADFGSANTHYLLTEPTPESLVETLQELICDPHKRDLIAEGGFKLVTNTLNVEQSLDRFAALFQQLKKG